MWRIVSAGHRVDVVIFGTSLILGTVQYNVRTVRLVTVRCCLAKSWAIILAWNNRLQQKLLQQQTEPRKQICSIISAQIPSISQPHSLKMLRSDLSNNMSTGKNNFCSGMFKVISWGSYWLDTWCRWLHHLVSLCARCDSVALTGPLAELAFIQMVHSLDWEGPRALFDLFHPRSLAGWEGRFRDPLRGRRESRFVRAKQTCLSCSPTANANVAHINGLFMSGPRSSDADQGNTSAGSSTGARRGQRRRAAQSSHQPQLLFLVTRI